jgi:hypothetical protein
MVRIYENYADFWEVIRNTVSGVQVKDIFTRILNSKKKISKNLSLIGINLLRSRISRPIHVTIPTSISRTEWDDILDVLKQDENYQKIFHQIQDLFNQNLRNQTELELKKILNQHPTLTKEEKEEFRTQFRKTGLSIDQFFKKKKRNQGISTSSRKITTKEESKIDFDGYQAYLEADERELARMKRTGDYSVRKRGKKRKRRNG